MREDIDRSRRVRRLPAWGKELAALRRNGQRPRCGVVIHLDSWPDERRIAFFDLVLPRDCDPQSIDWTAVRGLPVLLVRRPGTSLERTAATVGAVLHAQPAGLVLVEMDPDDDAQHWSTPIADSQGCLLTRQLVDHFVREEMPL